MFLKWDIPGLIFVLLKTEPAFTRELRILINCKIRMFLKWDIPGLIFVLLKQPIQFYIKLMLKDKKALSSKAVSCRVYDKPKDMHGNVP